MKSKYLFPSVILFSFLTISSCTKEAKDDIDISQSAFDIEANSTSDEFEKSADAVTFDKVNNACGPNGPIPECALVTIDYPEGTAFPKVITIDYGEVNCEVRPNLYKRGKEIITISDSLINMNAQRTITFEAFFINDNEVTGYKELTNLGANEDGFITFSIDNDLAVGTWSQVASGTKTWIEGFTTMGAMDNVFLLEGASLTIRNEISISRTITEALRVDRSCGYITEGIVSIVWNDTNTALIDFGDGTCDNLAIIYRDGQEFEIDLDLFRHRRRH